MRVVCYVYSFSIFLTLSHNKNITQTCNVPSAVGGEDTVQLLVNHCLVMKAQSVVCFGIAHMQYVSVSCREWVCGLWMGEAERIV